MDLQRGIEPGWASGVVVGSLVYLAVREAWRFRTEHNA